MLEQTGCYNCLMPKTAKKYDLIVIGAGSGGLVSAEYAAKLGAKVLLVEKEVRLGGDCLHTGCVPSKALLHAADSGMSFTQGLRHVQSAISIIEERSDNVEHLQSQGIDVQIGEARLMSGKSIEVHGQSYQFKKCILATGSRARAIDMPGLSNPQRVRTNETFFNKRLLPKRLTVIGGGPIGLEMATAMAKFGSKVTILEQRPQLLPFIDPRIATKAQEHLHQNIDIQSGATLLSATEKTITVRSSGSTKQIRYDEVLVAVGRIPVVPDGLDAANVKATSQGIVVDSHFRTTNKRIYAVGDVCLQQKFTHTAAESAAIALSHALYGVNGRKNRIPQTPFAIFSDPEVSAVGSYGSSVRALSNYHTSYELDYSAIDKAVTNDSDGLLLVHSDKKGYILGAEIVGESASELIGYCSLAMHAKVPLKTLAQTMMPYPTLSLGLKQLAAQSSLQKLKTFSPALNTIRRLRGIGR